MEELILSQQKEIKDLKDKVNFLCNYDKNDIAFSCTHFVNGWSIATATYLSYGELHEIDLPKGCVWVVEKNIDLYAIIKPKDDLSYYKLDKEHGKIVDITEEYNEILKNKKSKKVNNCAT